MTHLSLLMIDDSLKFQLGVRHYGNLVRSENNLMDLYSGNLMASICSRLEYLIRFEYQSGKE